MNRFLTVAEVARELNIHPKTVQALCRRGALRASRPAREWRIAPADLAAYIATTTNHETAPEPDGVLPPELARVRDREAKRRRSRAA